MLLPNLWSVRTASFFINKTAHFPSYYLLLDFLCRKDFAGMMPLQTQEHHNSFVMTTGCTFLQIEPTASHEHVFVINASSLCS